MKALALGIIADDLSGAAECASHAILRVSRSKVLFVSDVLAPAPPTDTPPDAVVTVDADSRRLGADAAARAVRAAGSVVAAAPVVVKKIDSLLRGHVATEVAALADELHRTPVVAVSNPALDRIVRDGVLHVGGTPLHHTDLWAVEPNPVPTRVAESLHPLPTVVVPHATVLLGVEAVAAAIDDAERAGLVPVCDAVTDADLDIVHAAAVAAAAEHGRGALLVGSGALADAAVRALPLRPRGPRTEGPRSKTSPTERGGPQLEVQEPGTPPDQRHGPLMEGTETGTQPDEHRGPRMARPARSVLFVLGTRAPGLAAQLEQLSAAHSAHTTFVQPDRLLADPEGVCVQLATLPRDGIVVVALDPAAPADPTRSRALTEALARAVAPLLDHHDACFLSGGETARAVLDRLGVTSLDVVAEVETGTVVSRRLGDRPGDRLGGRLVVTRPGSFGDPASLVRVVEHLLDVPAARRTAPPRTATRATTGATTEENS